ncbi:aminotransferase class IV [Corynebacterium tuscaniense]|uniref:aminotransferase class IV n=1 Tax=Corynebacterium tuscaniense TaxID=302449 RepID=UPI00123BCE59|nr:aminotransferase class IV [Corynebacterium tuscaniense]KAA8746757.1 aminotransferase class IV [Corynebacterium tuscaniense]
MSNYAWHDGFVPRDFPHGPFDVADSWRHSFGRTNGLDLHLKRFIHTAGPLPLGFVDEMLALLEQGELFPRIAATPNLLLLDIRPAPPARTETRLTYVSAPDPREHPLIKGPDFGALRAYRSLHQADNTDDTVITAPDGSMLETTTGALVMWGNDTLYVPDGIGLPSVTLHQVTAQAGSKGIKVAPRHITPELATEHPLWFLNSLHGISPVSEIHTSTGVINPPPHPNYAQWRDWWWDGFL